MKLMIYLFLATVLLNSGCVTAFTPKEQKVTIKAPKGATVKVYDGNVGNGTVTVPLIRKDRVVEIEVSKEGYKSRTICPHIGKVNWINPLLLADIGLGLAIPVAYNNSKYNNSIYSGGVSDVNENEKRFFLVVAVGAMCNFVATLANLGDPKTRNYANSYEVPELVKIPKRTENQKYLWLDKASVSIAENNFVVNFYKHNRLNKPYSSIKNKDEKKASNDTIEYDNTIFIDDLNVVLKAYSFVDSNKGIFPNKQNSLYLRAKITSITHNYIDVLKVNYLEAEVEAEWEILDYYQKSIYKTVIKKKSDPFRSPEQDSRKIIKKTTSDALDYALIELIASSQVQELLKLDNPTSTDKKLEVLEISKPNAILGGKMNDFIKSGVSVKVKDGHGSGFIISEDGYIISNYHVVVNEEENLEVILQDGTKHKAKLIRFSEEADLALLKIEATNLQALLFPTEKFETEIGVDVWAIGTPKNLKLGQSVSKGVISGLRNNHGMQYIQTDVSINSGNSGGALINKEGLVQGIITAKLAGFATEGIGFAIPAKYISEMLKLKYKK